MCPADANACPEFQNYWPLMKGRNSQEQGHKRKYEAANDSPDVRNTVGAIYAAMKRLGYEKDARDTVCLKLPPPL